MIRYLCLTAFETSSTSTFNRIVRAIFAQTNQRQSAIWMREHLVLNLADTLFLSHKL
jgi:hypothetical protein